MQKGVRYQEGYTNRPFYISIALIIINCNITLEKIFILTFLIIYILLFIVFCILIIVQPSLHECFRSLEYI